MEDNRPALVDVRHRICTRHDSENAFTVGSLVEVRIKHSLSKTSQANQSLGVSGNVSMCLPRIAEIKHGLIAV